MDLTRPVSTFAPAPSTWWEPLIRGVFALAFGIVLFAFPISAALVFVVAFGAFALVDGIIALVHAARAGGAGSERWWAMLARGAVGIVAGLVALIFPAVVAGAFGLLIAIWAIAAGALEIGASFRARASVPRELLLLVAGAITLALGLLLLFFPIAALVAQIWVVATYAIVAGIALVAYALRLRARQRGAHPAP